MKLSIVFASITALANTAVAHYRFTALILNGQATPEYQYVRRNTNINSPVTSVSSPDIRCNAGGASGANTQVANVQAGAQVGFVAERIGHPGPVNVYMSKAPSGDVKNYDGSGSWFKIAQLGAVIQGEKTTWQSDGADKVMATIPKSTPPGQYLLRVEHIALHGAGEAGGAQFYISCAQINVAGSGGANPSPTVTLPGGYNPSDPSLKVNIYWPPLTSYKNPGPAVWRG